MKDLEKELRDEIEKWRIKIEDELKSLKSIEDKKEVLENIKAYVRDSKYFYEKGDLIRAFEAIIWAWALLEINFRVEK